MALYHQPASLFCSRLPHDVILHVAFELATIEPVGPPRHLPSLHLVCKYISHILVSNRKLLLARIFRTKFDTRATLRRLGPTALTNASLAFQLKKQIMALKRLRHADFDSNNFLSDLWTAYIMYLENDGRNHWHLIEYARLDVLVDTFIETRLWSHRERLGWPLEITPNALIVWLFWHTMTPERLQAMIPDRRTRFMDLLRPFAVAPLQYPTFFAPDNHFDFPIDEQLRDGDLDQGTASPFYPLYRDPTMVTEHVLHYGRDIAIMAPVLGLGAKQAFIMLAEAVPYETPSMLPIDRAHADPAARAQPTQADFIEWAAVRGVQLYPYGQWDWLDRLTPEQQRLESNSSCRKELKSISSKFDNDWNRLTGCFDPYRDLSLKGVVYTFGSIVGMFAGRMQIPDFIRYQDMALGQNMPDPAAFPMLAELPIYICFREHHCVSPQLPVPTGGTHPGFDDGVLNAYLPKNFGYRHRNGLHVSIPGGSFTYEDYVEGEPNSHDPVRCTTCISRLEQTFLLPEHLAEHGQEGNGEVEADILMHDDSDDFAVLESDEEQDQLALRSRRGSGSSHTSHASYWFEGGDDPDGPLSTRQMTLEDDPDTEALLKEMMADSIPDHSDFRAGDECNGIQDIIITGETPRRHGEAWNEYRYYGRVRKWDGLVAIVQEPVSPNGGGRIIFRGYLIGNRNLVGSWRSYADNIQAIPLEGPFALSRVEE